MDSQPASVAIGHEEFKSNVHRVMSGDSLNSRKGDEFTSEMNEEYTDDTSESEDELPFEPYDIDGDGKIVKTASYCSRTAWKRPEAGWDVTITVHRFRELVPKIALNDEHGKQDDSRMCVAEAEPNLQLDLKLGDSTFLQEALNEAKAAGIHLNSHLHDGIETMGKNERATFVVTTDDGGGDDGKQSRCLEYDISLDDWTEEVDVSAGHDGSLVKRIIRDGDGSNQPVEVGRVTIRYRLTRRHTKSELSKLRDLDPARDQDEIIFDNLQSQDDVEDGAEGGSKVLKGPVEFVLDDCELGFGVVLLLKSMSQDELCEASLAPEYAAATHGEIGPFHYHITLELVAVEELPPLWASENIRLQMAQKFKLEGNDIFATGDFSRALRRYSKAIGYADGVDSAGESDVEDSDISDRSDEGTGSCDGRERKRETPSSSASPRNKFVDLQVAILCNQAACHLKLGDGASALELAERAASIMGPKDSPFGLKAAYRRACALEAIGEWNEARWAFKHVLSVDPSNIQSSQGLARIARREKAYRDKLRKSFGGCLVSGKLKGFASEGRIVTKSENDDGPLEDQDYPPLDDGPWSDLSGVDSDSAMSGDDEDEPTSGMGVAAEGENFDKEERLKHPEQARQSSAGGDGCDMLKPTAFSGESTTVNGGKGIKDAGVAPASEPKDLGVCPETC